MVEPQNDYMDMHHLRSADDTMTESSGSGYYDTASSNDQELKDLHIVIIAVGIFIATCFSLTCLVSVAAIITRSLHILHISCR